MRDGRPPGSASRPGTRLDDCASAHPIGEWAWLDALAAASSAAGVAVLVTVASARGSVPREPGARMVVTTDRIAGTIGGGHLEQNAIAIARRLLAAGRDVDLRRFPLGASLGQCCGGVVTLLFDPVAPGAAWVGALALRHRTSTACVVVTPSRGNAQERKLVVDALAVEGSLGSAEHDAAATIVARRMLTDGAPTGLASVGSDADCLFDVVRPPGLRVVLFGAGHVGRALVRVLGELDCRVTWVDIRDDVFPHRVPPNVECIATDTPEVEVAAAPRDACFLVMTHSHPLDQMLCDAILGRDDFRYFGLIGSIAKRRQFERRLCASGVDPGRFARMTCPIGVAGIGGKEPAAIAVAVAAELLQVQERAERAGQTGGGIGASGAREGTWRRS